MKVFESKTYQCAECLSVMEWVVLLNPRRFILRHPEEWMSGIGDCPNMSQQAVLNPDPIDLESEAVPFGSRPA